MTHLKSRRYSLDESLAIGLKEAELQKLNLQFQQSADFSNCISTFLCSSNDTKLKMSFVGGGSGLSPLEAKVKAVFEALEWNIQHKVTRFVSAETDWTGLGTGATSEEAIIHGISEWMERDGYAIFLLRSIVKRSPEKLRLIDRQTLPSKINELIATIEKESKDSLSVIDLTTDLKIPAILVAFTKQPSFVQPMGFGSSLFKEEALHQALLEAVQAHVRHNSETEGHRRNQFISLGEKVALQKAFKCDLSHFFTKDLLSYTDWIEIPDYSPINTLAEQVALLRKLLAKKGFQISTQNLFAGQTGLSVCHVTIDGLETFYRIKEGRFTPPTSRGLEALK